MENGGGGLIDGFGGGGKYDRTVMIVAVVVGRHEYNGSGGTEKTEMVSDAYVWWNRKWFKGEYKQSGGAGMGVYGSGVCFEYILGRLYRYEDGDGRVVMETLVYLWPGNNGNGNVIGTMETEEMCVLDGERVGGVRVYKEELVLGRRKRWSCGAMEIFVCRVTEILATTEEHVSFCHMW